MTDTPVQNRIRTAADFGTVIRQRRLGAELTQTDLAAAAGTGVRFIVELEQGKPTCQLGKALRVAAMLGIHLSAIGES
jgi:HTH-type transcriptional regulator / antitoxin HipB